MSTYFDTSHTIPPQVSAYLDIKYTGDAHKPGSDYSYRGIRVDELKTSVVLAPTSTILKDILAERWNLHKLDKDNEEKYLFVLPRSLIVGDQSFAHLEFLIYHNAYVLVNLENKKPLDVVCTKDQKRHVTKLLEKTILGPDWQNPEVYSYLPEDQRRFLSNVSEYFAPKDSSGERLPLSAYVQFHTFDNNGEAQISYQDDGLLMIRERTNHDDYPSGYEVAHIQLEGNYVVSRTKESLLVNYNVPVMPLREVPEDLKQKMLDEQNFSVTCLGNSTGFDPNDYATSFIVWMKGTGMVVDPSPEAIKTLENLGFNDVNCPYVLLTHCHEDHDGGLLSLILQGKKINLIASRIVFEEFLAKANCLLQCQNFPVKIDPEALVNWTELHIGQETKLPLKIGKEPAILNAWWNLHTIPTNGFSVTVGGKTYGHSSDTQISKTFLAGLVEKNILTEQEAFEQWDRWFDPDGIPRFDFSHFEAGGPPIHTNESDLFEGIHPDYRSSVKIYHLSNALHTLTTVNNDNREMLSRAVLYDTEVLIPATTQTRKAHHRSIVGSNDFLVENKLVQKVVEQGSIVNFQSGDCLMHPLDEPRDTMFIVLSGQAAIKDAEGRYIGTSGPGSFLGDWGHFTETSPSAEVKAKTSMICMEVNMRKILENNPDLLKDLRNNAIFQANYTLPFALYLSKLGISLSNTPSLMSKLSPAMKHIDLKPQSVLIKEGEQADTIYFIVSGSLNVFHTNKEPDQNKIIDLGTVCSPDIIGERALIPGATRSASVRAGENGAVVLSIEKEAFQELLNEYPGFANAFNLYKRSRVN
jgi:CRP-like cAMP-binding protein